MYDLCRKSKALNASVLLKRGLEFSHYQILSAQTSTLTKLQSTDTKSSFVNPTKYSDLG